MPVKQGQWVRVRGLPWVHRVVGSSPDWKGVLWATLEGFDPPWRAGLKPQRCQAVASALEPCEPAEDAAHELVWLCQGGQP